LFGVDGLDEESPVDNWTKYFRYTLDHKVVGLQYVVGVILFMFTGGLLAMAIRAELLNPTTHLFSPDTYIKIVSEHGTIMMMMATSIIVGPLGNYFVPLMIGARRMAFPRIEALSFWIFTAGYMVIFSALPTVASRLVGPATRRCRPRPSRHGVLLAGFRRHWNRNDSRGL